MDESQLQALEAELNRCIAASGGMASACDDLKTKLTAAAAEYTKITNKQAEDAKRAERASKAWNDTITSMFSNSVTAVFTQIFLKNLPEMTQKIWGAEKAFDALTPTVDAIGKSLSELISIPGKMLDGVSAFGFSLGNIPSGVAKSINFVIDGITKSLEFQLSAAQKVFDAFSAASAAGGEFAGSLTQFSRDALAAQVPMTTLSKIVTENIAKIANFGTGIASGATRVAGLARSIVENDGAILSLYGNFNTLSGAVADYLELQATLGENAKKYDADNRRGLDEYLIRQKELTSITGKNNETLKQEEARRRNQLDYNLKMGRLGATAQQNVQEGLSLAGKLFGESGAKYAEEYFATGGKIFTKEAIAFAAQMPDVADAIGKTLDSTEIEKDRQSYRQGISGTLKDLGPALSSYAGSLESLAEINRAAQNSQLTMMSDVATALQKNKTLIDNYDALIKMLDARRADQPPAQRDTVTETYRLAYDAMLKRQTDIDDAVMKNMKNIPELTTQITELQKKLLNLQFNSIEIYGDLFNGLTKFGSKISDIGGALDILMGAIKKNTSEQSTSGSTNAPFNNPAEFSVPAPSETATSQLSRPESTNTNQPALAEGGLTSGPTLTGERGVEAVIPLAKGNVPLDIDFTPVIAEMKNSSRLMEELVRTMDDTKDIQRQILNAAY